MTARSPVLAIGGPTAAGKTVLAVELARRLGGEVVNADSRQVIRRLRVGTATPTAAELGGVRCHLVDLCEPGEPFAVAHWLAAARTTLAELHARGMAAIIAGGTGQYLRALREGWQFDGAPAPDPALRAELTAAACTAPGLAQLAAELRDRDADGAAATDMANPRRVIRALELLRTGSGSLAAARARDGGVVLDLVVLDAERELHREQLGARVAAMFDGGALVAEVDGELRRGTSPTALRRAGIGYTEALRLRDGEIDGQTARALTLQRTVRYVKAQRTWFRAEPALLHLTRSRSSTTAALANAVIEAVRRSAGSPGPGSHR